MSLSRQLPLFVGQEDESIAIKPVNVASVPQRSPFRYPGGKTWFVPTFREWMQRMQRKPRMLVEPFAGGGVISLTAVFEDLVESAVMVELDEEIAAVWQAVADGDAHWLAQRILEFNLTRESILAELSRTPVSIRERAFQTILKNRTLHGGILAPGSSFLKHGENGKGIRSRWYPETLARRFESLDLVRHRISFQCRDGLEAIRDYAAWPDAVFFIDPPYTAGGKRAGKRLYRHCDLDHERLFSLCKSVQGEFLLTYDNAEEVRILARRHGFQMRLIPMKNTHHAQMEELVIGKDLGWMARLPAVREPTADYRVGLS